MFRPPRYRREKSEREPPPVPRPILRYRDRADDDTDDEDEDGFLNWRSSIRALRQSLTRKELLLAFIGEVLAMIVMGVALFAILLWMEGC